MKTAIFATLLAGAAAFAPAQTGKASTALRAFEDEVSFCNHVVLPCCSFLLHVDFTFDWCGRFVLARGKSMMETRNDMGRSVLQGGCHAWK